MESVRGAVAVLECTRRMKSYPRAIGGRAGRWTRSVTLGGQRATSPHFAKPNQSTQPTTEKEIKSFNDAGTHYTTRRAP